MTDREVIVLFGAGQLGRRTAECIRSRYKVVYCDNNLGLQSIEGIPVIPLIVAMEAFPDAPFIVTIYNGQLVHEQLKASGVKDVRHFMDFYLENADLCLPYACLEVSHPDTIWDREEELSALVTDQKSRDVIGSTVRSLAFMRPKDFKHDHPDNIYFPSFIKPLDDEVFVDVGAFDGDTIRSFIKHRGGEFGKIVAFEPDTSNMWRLAEYLHTIGDFHNVSIFPCVVGNQVGLVPFLQCASASSRVSLGGDTVLSTKIDGFLSAIPTYIKCDAEGAELDVLEGARETIKEHYPVLAFCLYHKQSHLYEIPLLMKEISPDYEIFIRCYAESPFETVAYAVPHDRIEWEQVQR